MKKSKYIDHTLLKQDATKDMIIELCNQAKEHDFASVCVNPYWIKDCYQLLKDTDVKVCTVIGFPLGANTTSTKVFEAKQAIEDGATELDMVINISALKSKQDEIVFNDIKAIKDEAKDVVLKVIIETCLLTKDEIVKACELAMKANADFVKTSTGFSTSGAQVEDVKLMKETVKNKLEVKASGGIKTKEDFDAMVEAGATRVGTSNGVALL